MITNEEIFRSMWSWCAETGRDKSFWSGWDFNGGPIKPLINECAACQESAIRSNRITKYSCSCCPVEWPGQTLPGLKTRCNESLFPEWKNCRDIKHKKLLAKQISELEWK